MQSRAGIAAREFERSGAEICCDVLKENGVELVFGYGGGAILHFYDALHRDPDLRHVTVRHEQGAAHAAAGYARASGRVGVCVATSGPGVTNLVTGIMDAHLDSVPVVALGGQVATPLIGRDAFQETDMMSITASITKHAFQPRTVGEVGPALAAAFEIARSGRPGPVYVDLPKDVLSDTVRLDAAPAVDSVDLGGTKTPVLDPAARDVAAAAHLLRAAARPVLLLGGGALSCDARDELVALAEVLGLPVVTTIHAKGVFPESHPLALGMIGMYGRKSGIWALGEADVLVALGCRFTDRITGRADAFAAGKRLIHVDVDAYELGKNLPATVAMRADAGRTVRALLAACRGYEPSPGRRRWRAQSGVTRDVCMRCVPHAGREGLHPKEVMDELNRVRRENDVVTTGVGQHQMFACHFLEFDRPRRLLTSGGAGTMGYGLPAAIGAAHACPDATVFVVDGDGSFQMTCQELATAAQEDLRIVILVLDNRQLGMVRQWQDREYDGRPAASRFDQRPGHPDFAQLARAFGIHAETVGDRGALGVALDDAVGRAGPVLLHVRVDPSSDNFPMMPAGRTFAEYGGNCVRTPGRLFEGEDARRIARVGQEVRE